MVNKTLVLVLGGELAYKIAERFNDLCVCPAGVILTISVVFWLTCRVAQSFPVVGVNE